MIIVVINHSCAKVFISPSSISLFFVSLVIAADLSSLSLLHTSSFIRWVDLNQNSVEKDESFCNRFDSQRNCR